MLLAAVHVEAQKVVDCEVADLASVRYASAAIRAEDPQGTPVPYTVSGGTDAKAFSELGITCYGFLPLLLPPDLDFAAMFHGVDERVPVDGLRFGMRVMDRFVRLS